MNGKSLWRLSIVVFLWGSSFTLLKVGLEEIPPMILAFLRFLLTLPFFVAVAYFQHKKLFERTIFRDWKALLFLGLTSITLYHVCQNVGLQMTTASNSSLIISANPIFTALLAHFYLKEMMTWKRGFGIVLAFIGIILIIGPLRLIFNPKATAGDLLSLGAALSWAVSSVFGKKMLSHSDAYTVTVFSMIFGTLLLFPISVTSEKLPLLTSIWLWILLLILSWLCSGLCYFLWYKALEEVSATKVAVSLFFLPVVSVLIARLVLLEPLDSSFAMGAILVISGVAITELS